MSRNRRVLGVSMCVMVLTFFTATGAHAGGHYHVVAPGETLYAIGRLYGVHPNDIAAANHLANPDLIYPGQVLALPAFGWHGDLGVAQHHWPGPWHDWPPYAQPEWAALQPADMCPSWLTCLADDGCGLTNATAICRDGTCSCSQSSLGSCWGHGGVRCWVSAEPESVTPSPYVEGRVDQAAAAAPAPAWPPVQASHCSESAVVNWAEFQDGDSFHVWGDGQADEVRLIGVDAPEWNEPFGAEAQALVRGLTWNQPVCLQRDANLANRDRYGRLLRYVWVDGVLVNAELLRHGYAEAYKADAGARRYSWFLQLESEAKAAARGLWSGGPFVSPAVPAPPPPVVPMPPVVPLDPYNVFADAWVSDPTPRQYAMLEFSGRLTAEGSPVDSALMQVSWDAGSATGQCSAVTGTDGKASCETYLSGAEPGYSVPVVVTFTHLGQVYTAYTSFVPWW